jgi:hypothetical protein
MYLRYSVRHGYLAAPPRQFVAPLQPTIDSRWPETAFGLYFRRRRFVAELFLSFVQGR